MLRCWGVHQQIVIIKLQRTLFAHQTWISNNFKRAISECKGVLHCEGYDYEENPDDIQKLRCLLLFSQEKWKMEMLSNDDGFMIYGKLGVEFFSTSELLYPKKKVRIRLFNTKPNIYMISDNSNVSVGVLDWSFYTRRLKDDDYHKKRPCLHTLLSSTTIRRRIGKHS